MSRRQSGWKARGGQPDAAAAIDMVLDERPHPGERVLFVDDGLVDDSPYQARALYNPDQLGELTQGMREAGFQGVLLVRSHPAKAGRFELVFGHRRRLAWRQVCAERNELCRLPVIVRAFSDAQLLTIGAQENLQREDLGPLEEAQVVAWHRQLFFERNLAEIGTMLGKSESWVKARSQVAQLPEPLKDVLREHPDLMSHILEVARLWKRSPAAATRLATLAATDQLTLAQVRVAVRDVLEPEARENQHNQSVNGPADTTGVHNESNVLGGAGTRPERRAAVETRDDGGHVRAIQRQTAEIQRVLMEWAIAVERTPTQRAAVSAACSQLIGDLEQLLLRLQGEETPDSTS